MSPTLSGSRSTAAAIMGMVMVWRKAPRVTDDNRGQVAGEVADGVAKDNTETLKPQTMAAAVTPAVAETGSSMIVGKEIIMMTGNRCDQCLEASCCKKS